MDELRVFSNTHWIVTHRRDSRYDGYLIISSEETASDLSDLSDEAMSSLGLVMKTLGASAGKGVFPLQSNVLQIGIFS